MSTAQGTSSFLACYNYYTDLQMYFASFSALIDLIDDFFKPPKRDKRGSTSASLAADEDGDDLMDDDGNDDDTPPPPPSNPTSPAALEELVNEIAAAESVEVQGEVDVAEAESNNNSEGELKDPADNDLHVVDPI